jgi:hypothetical protein
MQVGIDDIKKKFTDYKYLFIFELIKCAPTMILFNLGVTLNGPYFKSGER